MKKILVFLLIVIAAVAYYHYVPKMHHGTEGEAAYVLPQTLPVVDTTAVIRNVIATLHGGQQVRVTARLGRWASLLLANGQTGWVEQKDLIDAETYAQGQELLKKLQSMQVQAVGHTSASVSLRLDCSRDATELAEFGPGQHVAVYGRRWVARTPQPGATGSGSIHDAWYLVRRGKRAGWILGHFVDLDIPAGLTNYAQGINMVAWLTLDTVDDGGQEVPQYLAADRIGTREFDFNHIRVFTWWIKRHKYVTAYVESNLDGYFPLAVTHLNNVPYFRLRLVDDQGDKYQKVYGLFDTIVRPMGAVDGWTSDAMPAVQTRRRSRRHRK